MTDNPVGTFGMVRVTMSDHTAAAYLRKHGAILDWRITAHGTMWYAPAKGTGKSGMPARCVLLCVYDGIREQPGAISLHQKQWIPADLVESGMVDPAPVWTLADRKIHLNGIPFAEIRRAVSDPESNGYAFPPHSLDALARRIVDLLNANHDATLIDGVRT